jgi:hypothetical protein
MQLLQLNSSKLENNKRMTAQNILDFIAKNKAVP